MQRVGGIAGEMRQAGEIQTGADVLAVLLGAGDAIGEVFSHRRRSSALTSPPPPAIDEPGTPLPMNLAYRIADAMPGVCVSPGSFNVVQMAIGVGAYLAGQGKNP